MAPMLPPDIILLICEELGNQRAFGTLFNAASSSRHLAGSALLWMYRIHNHASIRGGESSEAEMSKTGTFKETSLTVREALQKQTISKWALQWRSIILSSLGETAYPYCLYIRSLELTNLEDLLTDNVFRKSMQDQFFADGMRHFLKASDNLSKTKCTQRSPANPILSLVGESISRYASEFADRNGGTVALEELSGLIEKDALPKWITRLSRLRSLTLWDGSILNRAVADIINARCLDFDTLSLFYCVGGNEVDTDLASFFGGLRSNALRSLQVISCNDINGETFLSLNNHHDSLNHLKLGNLKAPAIRALPLLKGCTAIQVLDLEEDAFTPTDLEATDKDILLEIIAWLTSCKQLKSISLRNFANGPRILTSVCLEEAIHLESLQLIKYRLTGNQDFHRALSHQTSLESLSLRADAEDVFRDDIDIVVSSLCKLTNLKYLNILDTSDYFRTSEVQLLAMHLSKLEDFSVGGYDITDEVWYAISTLPYLRSLSFHAVTSFTFKGILNYISTLRNTNAGLQLSVMCAAIESELNLNQQSRIKDALAKKVDGKFEFVMFRENESDFPTDSD